MRLLTLLLALALILVPARGLATAQEPDLLVLDGTTEPIFTNPLEPFLARNPALRPKPPHTANWRGYVATFRIKDSGLWLQRVEVSTYLGEIDGEHTDRISDELPTFFPGRSEVLADWYTGVLVIPRGRQVSYVHMGYGSTYERYVLLEIRAGELLRRLDMTAAEFEAHKRRKFADYQQTAAYAQQLEQARSDGMDKEMADRFLFEYESANYLTQSLSPGDE